MCGPGPIIRAGLGEAWTCPVARRQVQPGVARGAAHSRRSVSDGAAAESQFDAHAQFIYARSGGPGPIAGRDEAAPRPGPSTAKRCGTLRRAGTCVPLLRAVAAGAGGSSGSAAPGSADFNKRDAHVFHAWRL